MKPFHRATQLHDICELAPNLRYEDELKELKEEVARLTKVIENFKKMYNNWYKFKHHLGL